MSTEEFPDSEETLAGRLADEMKRMANKRKVPVFASNQALFVNRFYVSTFGAGSVLVS